MRYKLCVIIASSLFIIGIGTGLILGSTVTSTNTGAAVSDSLFSEILEALEELAATLGPFQATTAIFIFVNNAITLIFSFILSPLLCLLPILVLTINGALISFVSVIVTQEESLSLVLAGLLPHGVFEIPAIIIGEAAALYFGASVIMALFSSEKNILMPIFKQCLKYLLLALVLLVPAAIIETYITPLFLQ